MLNKLTVTMGLGSVALLVVGLLLASKEIIPPLAGMGVVVLSGLFGVVAIALAIAVILKTQQFQYVMLGMFGLLPALLLAGAIVDGMRYPPINDVSTSPREAPEFVHAPTMPKHAGVDLTFPQKWAAIVERGYPDLAPAIVSRPPADVFATVVSAASQQPDWEVTYKDPAAGIVEGVAKTKLLRFADDFVIRVKAEGDGKTRVDMRSRSRVGRSDLGANAKRIRKFLARIQ